MICMPTIRSMTTRSRLEQLNTCPPEAFCAALADLWEHAPWVVHGVVDQRPFATVEALHAAIADRQAGAQVASDGGGDAGMPIDEPIAFPVVRRLPCREQRETLPIPWEREHHVVQPGQVGGEEHAREVVAVVERPRELEDVVVVLGRGSHDELRRLASRGEMAPSGGDRRARTQGEALAVGEERHRRVGLRRVRGGETSVASAAREREGLLLALPVPASETQVMDQSGHHLRERETSFHEFTIGTHERNSRVARAHAGSTIHGTCAPGT